VVSVKRRGGDSWTSPYRGGDRRVRNVGVVAQLPAGRLLSMSVLVAAGAGVPALFLLLRPLDLTTLDSYLAVAAGLLCVAAGATWLVVWRILGCSLPGWLGCACIVLGVLTLVSNAVSYLGAGPLPASVSLDDLVRVAIVGWLVWRGVTDHEVNAALHPMVSLLVALGAGTAAMGILNVAGAHGLLGWVASASSMQACNAASAAIWLAVAIAGVKRSTEADLVPPWTVGAVIFFMLACVAQCFEQGTRLATVVGLGFLLLGAALVDGTAITRLQGVLAGGDRMHARLQSALAASRRQALGEQEQLEEWLHDVRNAVAGLQAADAVLKAVPSVPAEHAELADAVTAELTRLHALVDRSRRVDIVDIDLEEVIEPILTAERALGSVVRAHFDGLSVQADRSALCRIVQNVLLNARRHAPSTPVVISAEQLGDVVELSVRDGGPGVPSHERRSIFERGCRGSVSQGAPGSGLGLYVARTLALAMGGDMCIRADGLPGCCIVLTLPSAAVRIGQSPLEPAV
jgi:signal transduction histidine kinase